MPIQLNDRITLKNNIPGVVRYIGPVEGRDEEWVGIELDEPRGGNNGCISGRRYFSCSENHGLFVKYRKLTQKMSAMDTLGRSCPNELTLDSQEPPRDREIFETRPNHSGGGVSAKPVHLNSMHEGGSLFAGQDKDWIVEENRTLKEQGDKYKQIASVVLEKSSAALDGIQSSLEEIQSRINRLKVRRRTETERDRVVQLVSQIYKAEKNGDSTEDAYNEFKAIMEVHGINVD